MGKVWTNLTPREFCLVGYLNYSSELGGRVLINLSSTIKCSFFFFLQKHMCVYICLRSDFYMALKILLLSI